MPCFRILRGIVMKLKCKFEFVDMGDEIVAVPVGKNSESVLGVLKINEEGKYILQLLEKNVTKEDVLSSISTNYVVDKDALTNFVDEFIDRLIEYRVLEEL